MGATLTQITGGLTGDPVLDYLINDHSQVEPLAGPITVDDVVDRFPDTVYNKGKDTHLYRFLSALCGDSGAGYLTRLSYASRLRTESTLLVFEDLDTYFQNTLHFPRLKSEIYDIDPSDVLTADQWNMIEMADTKYRNRAIEFMHGLQYGLSPAAMALVASAGSGIECEIVENYQYIFDTLSDDPLGVDFAGTTNSPFEYIINARLDTTDASTSYQVGGTSPYSVQYSYNTGNVKKIVTDGGTQHRMDPQLERNMVDTLDQVRPVGSFLSVIIGALHLTPYLFDASTVLASSVRQDIIRFVTGSSQVSWPDIDPTQGYYIRPGVELQAPQMALSGRPYPVIFQTIQGAAAYMDTALLDPTYGTSDFFSAASPPSPYSQVRSQHRGTFLPTFTSIFPFLRRVPADDEFSADKAIAIQTVPLVLEARSR